MTFTCHHCLRETIPPHPEDQEDKTQVGQVSVLQRAQRPQRVVLFPSFWPDTPPEGYEQLPHQSWLPTVRALGDSEILMKWRRWLAPVAGVGSGTEAGVCLVLNLCKSRSIHCNPFSSTSVNITGIQISVKKTIHRHWITWKAEWLFMSFSPSIHSTLITLKLCHVLTCYIQFNQRTLSYFWPHRHSKCNTSHLDSLRCQVLLKRHLKITYFPKWTSYL